MGQIIQPSMRDSISLGGRTITDVDNVIMLIASWSGSVYTTFRKPEASAGYQVPASKVFRILAFDGFNANAVASDSVEVIYGDTDVGINSTPAPTNPVRPGAMVSAILISATLINSLQRPLKWDIPTAKYLSLAAFTGGSYGTITLWGVER